MSMSLRAGQRALISAAKTPPPPTTKTTTTKTLTTIRIGPLFSLNVSRGLSTFILLPPKAIHSHHQQQQQQLQQQQPHHQKQQQQSVQWMSTYAERKAEAKNSRRELYEERQRNKERRRHRRDGKPHNVKKDAFRSWFQPLREEHWNLHHLAHAQGLSWNIKVATVVERLPVILPDVPKWAKDYADLKSFLDSYTPEYPPELNLNEKKPYASVEEAAAGAEEDLLASVPKGFVPGPRETEADATGNVQTLDRQLKTRVYLTVKTDQTNINSSSSSSPKYLVPSWEFPTTMARTNETLLDGAQRAINEAIGSDSLKLWLPSNAPMGVQLRVYETDEEKNKVANKGCMGEKTFYYRLQYSSGNVLDRDLQNDFLDFAWLTREEITKRVEEETNEQTAKFYHYFL